MKKEFNRNDLAAIKRAAASTAPLIAKRNKLLLKKMELQSQIDDLQNRIDLFNMPIKEMTGYNAEELVERKADNSFALKYPDTIIPEVAPEFAYIAKERELEEIEYMVVEDDCRAL